jgi:uncharacterized damage-inducible protein DinB
MDLLDRLLGHDHWATTQLFGVARGLTDAQLDRPFDVGQQTLRATFAHMIFNIEGWSAPMAGRRPEFDREDRSLDDLIDSFERAFTEFAAVARRVRDEGRFDDTYTDHFDQQMGFGGAILHVILHNEGHRVELLHILQRLGLTDLPEIDHGLWDFVRRGLFQP